MVESRKQDQRFLKFRFLNHAPVNNLQAIDPVTSFGTEFEIFGLSETQLSFVDQASRRLDGRWTSDEDGSIEPDDLTQGREIISPPCSGKALNQIFHVSTMLDTLKAKTNLPCALHVHAGIKNTFPASIRYPLMRQIALNYWTTEDEISHVIAGKERNYLTNAYRDTSCRWSWTPDIKTIALSSEATTEGQFIESMNVHGRRHSRINFEPLGHYGTIEFRQHEGTVKPAEVIAWIGFINDFMRASLDMVTSRNAHLPSDNERLRLMSLVATLAEKRQPAYERHRFPLPVRVASPQFAV